MYIIHYKYSHTALIAQNLLVLFKLQKSLPQKCRMLGNNSTEKAQKRQITLIGINNTATYPTMYVCSYSQDRHLPRHVQLTASAGHGNTATVRLSRPLLQRKEFTKINVNNMLQFSLMPKSATQTCFI